MSNTAKKETPVQELSQRKDETLFQLVSLAAEIQRTLVESFGEVSPETEAALSLIMDKLPSKADGYKFVVDDLRNQSALWKKRAQDFTSIAKSFEAYADKMEDGIKTACLVAKVDELAGNDYRWKLQRAKPTVIIDDPKQVPSGHRDAILKISLPDDSNLLEQIISETKKACAAVKYNPPSDFIELEIKCKKASILEDLKSNLPVPGAHMEESLYVMAYPNTKGGRK